MHRHYVDEQPIETVDPALAGDQAPGGDQFLEIFGIDQRFGAGFAKLAQFPGKGVGGVGRRGDGVAQMGGYVVIAERSGLVADAGDHGGVGDGDAAGNAGEFIEGRGVKHGLAPERERAARGAARLGRMNSISSATISVL
jgi:hypothetical protein